MPRKTLEYMAVTESTPTAARASASHCPHLLLLCSLLSLPGLLSVLTQPVPPCLKSGNILCVFFLIGMLCPRTSTFFVGSSANLKCRHSSSNLIKNLKEETAELQTRLMTFCSGSSPEQMHRAYTPTTGPAFVSALYMVSSSSLKSSCLGILFQLLFIFFIALITILNIND